MSRNTKIIEKALRDRGYEPESIKWEHIGGCMEMCGPEGGWTVIVHNYSDVIVGYNVSEVLREIGKMDTASE